MSAWSYVRCPYCQPPPAVGRKKPQWHKRFEVKQTARNLLIFRCLKCNGQFYYRFFGKVMTDKDINQVEVKDIVRESERDPRSSEDRGGEEDRSEEVD